MIIKDYKRALEALLQGHIVALPTETVYGLAARADDDDAIAKIYSCKNRPTDHPLIIHVAKNWSLDKWVKPYPKYVEKLIANFWPGPLTLVFDIKPGILSSKINAGLGTIAIRCPDHFLMQQVLEHLAVPLAAPSANLYGKVSPTSAQHVQETLNASEILILDGGSCNIGIESTILLVNDHSSATILRPGSIMAEDLSEIIPDIEIIQHSNQNIPVSGNKLTHYQPNKKLYLFDDIHILSEFITLNKCDPLIWAMDYIPGDVKYLPKDPKSFAQNLYNILRDSDKSKNSEIMLQLPPNLPEWFAIRERLLKAGQKL